MREVETAAERVNVRTALMNVVAENFAQARLQNVTASVVAFGCLAEFRVNCCGNFITDFKAARRYLAVAYELTAAELFGVDNVYFVLAARYCTSFADGTAHFRV